MSRLSFRSIGSSDWIAPNCFDRRPFSRKRSKGGKTEWNGRERRKKKEKKKIKEKKEKEKRKEKEKEKERASSFFPRSFLLLLSYSPSLPVKKKEKENEKKRKEKGNAKREARETENATKSAPLFGILLYYLNTYILLYSIARKSPSPGTADIFFFFIYIFFTPKSERQYAV